MTQPSGNPVPELTAEERVALRESILQYGIMTPVIRSSGPACEGMLVDGFHRTELGEELGVEVPTHYLAFATEAEFRIAQIELNLQRRQLTIGKKIMLGISLEPWERELAKDRMATGVAGGNTRDLIGAKLGMSGTTYERGKRILEQGDPLTVEAFLLGHISVREGLSRLRKTEKREKWDAIQTISVAPPTGRYRTLVIDPPWDNGSAQYPTQTEAEIGMLPIQDLLEADAFVWLWTVNSLVPQALRLLDHWELRYVGLATWDKELIGTGYWLHGQTEQVLLAVNGSPEPGPSQRKSLIRSKRREHSRKPDEFYDLAEKMDPCGPRLDMYSREERPGWSTWGAETAKFSA